MYGISIPNLLQGCSDFIRSIDANILPCIELQGDLIQDRKFIQIIRDKNLYFIDNYKYIKNSMILNSLEQPDMFQDELLLVVDSILTDPLYFNLASLTIDFGLFREDNTEKILRFIHKLYYHIFTSGKNICMPVSFPGMEEKEDKIRKALYSMMINKFKLCLNIYPHNLKKNEENLNFLNSLNFRVEFVRICYNAIFGNCITDACFAYLKDILHMSDLNCPIVFAPTVNSIEMFEQEVVNIYKLIKL